MSATDSDTLGYEASQFIVTSSLGPAIFQWQLNMFMMGAMLVQYYAYITSDLYRVDNKRTKIVLHLVVLLAATQSVLSWWEVSHYTLDQKRDSAILLYNLTVPEMMDTTWVGLVQAIVQVFLAHRASTLLPRSRWVWVYWFFIAIGTLAGLIGSFFFLAENIVYIEALPYELCVGLLAWGSTFTDILITTTLVVTLRGKKQNFSKQTDGILQRLINIALASAAPTALLSLLCALFTVLDSYLPAAASNIGAAFRVPAGLYVMGMVANLNGRNSVREAAKSTVFQASLPKTTLDHASRGTNLIAASPPVRVGFPINAHAERSGLSALSEKRSVEDRV